jgi:xanthine dehydrogenase accessory factor
MREVLDEIERWRAAGMQVAVARVVAVEGSGPRDPGATMAVNSAGEVAGSVSGGCVEGAVVTEALDALATGAARRQSYGYSDAEAFAVGLTCGGTVHVLVEPRPPAVFESLRLALVAGDPVVLATVVEVENDKTTGGRPTDRDAGSRGDPPMLGRSLLVFGDGRVEGSLGAQLSARVLRDAAAALDTGRSATRHYGDCGETLQETVGVFFEVFAPPPRLVIFGAVDFTAALTRLGKLLGYHVTVCDARPVFATSVRFPAADEVVAQQPDRFLASVSSSLGPRDAVCVLTHDAKFDVPAIVGALGTKVGYLGVMGSRRTHADRVARLRQAGVTDDALRRVMAPIGLDIGARTPEETAVAICAEIIALRSGREVPSLRDGSGPIHRPVSDVRGQPSD